MIETQKTDIKQLRDLVKSQQEEKECIIKAFQQEDSEKEAKVVKNLNILMTDLNGKEASSNNLSLEETLKLFFDLIKQMQ